jgi:hypothetical protein
MEAGILATPSCDVERAQRLKHYDVLLAIGEHIAL